MKGQIAGMEAEVKRLTEEAIAMDPSLKPKKKRGRPRKKAAA